MSPPDASPEASLPLPRSVELDERGAALFALLDASRAAMWPWGKDKVPKVPFNANLGEALRLANVDGAIVRGLEGATKTLRDEAKGIAAADAKTGAARGTRVSRVLLIANDGSKRFYRDVEALLAHHRDRLLVVIVEADETTLGEAAFGDEALARALLITRKATVASTLLALVPSGE
jgi:hypothetical protein